MRWLLMIVAVLISISCEKKSVTSPENSVKYININETFEVRAGQSVMLSNREFVFRYDSVIQDSRCPVFVYCIHGGSASIHITVSYRC